MKTVTNTSNTNGFFALGGKDFNFVWENDRFLEPWTLVTNNLGPRDALSFFKGNDRLPSDKYKTNFIKLGLKLDKDFSIEVGHIMHTGELMENYHGDGSDRNDNLPGSGYGEGKEFKFGIGPDAKNPIEMHRGILYVGFNMGNISIRNGLNSEYGHWWSRHNLQDGTIHRYVAPQFTFPYVTDGSLDRPYAQLGRYDGTIWGFTY